MSPPTDIMRRIHVCRAALADQGQHLRLHELAVTVLGREILLTPRDQTEYCIWYANKRDYHQECIAQHTRQVDELRRTHNQLMQDAENTVIGE